MNPADTGIIERILSIWIGGGPLMIPLALLALALYYALAELFLFFSRYDFAHADPDRWRHILSYPQDAGDDILERVVRYARVGAHNTAGVRGLIAEIEALYIGGANRRIAFAAVLTGAAPLTGLLGTVLGMLGTFDGLAQQAAGVPATGLVAAGISQALITTQTGLVIAIPASILLNRIRRKRDAMATFFLHLQMETLAVLCRGAAVDQKKAS
ncbi:MAG: MotA/TolQ/ExbB proton channel family protein [Opitutales bacterium]